MAIEGVEVPVGVQKRHGESVVPQNADNSSQRPRIVVVPSILTPPTIRDASEISNALAPEVVRDMREQRRLGEVIESEVRATLGNGVAHLYRSRDPALQVDHNLQIHWQQQLDSNEGYVAAVNRLAEYTQPRVIDTINDYADDLGAERAQEVGKAALIIAAKSWRYTEHSFTEYARAQMVQALRSTTREQQDVSKVEKRKGIEKLPIAATISRKNGVFTVIRPDGTTITMDENNLNIGLPKSELREQTRIKLTERDIEILQFVGEGLTREQIAKKINISSKTVKNNLSVLNQNISQDLLGLEGNINSYQVYAFVHMLGLLKRDPEMMSSARAFKKKLPEQTLIFVGNLKITLKELAYLKELVEFNHNSENIHKIANKTIQNALVDLRNRHRVIDEEGKNVNPNTFAILGKVLDAGLLDQEYVNSIVKNAKEVGDIWQRERIAKDAIKERILQDRTFQVGRREGAYVVATEHNRGVVVSDRAVQCFDLLSQGYTKEEIAHTLEISVSTIKDDIITVNSDLAAVFFDDGTEMSSYKAYAFLYGLGLVGEAKYQGRDLEILQALIEEATYKGVAVKKQISEKGAKNSIAYLSKRSASDNQPFRSNSFSLIARAIKEGSIDVNKINFGFKDQNVPVVDRQREISHFEPTAHEEAADDK